MFQGEGSLDSSQQGGSGIMSQPKKEKPSFQGEGGVDTTPQKPPSRPPSKPSFTFQGEGGEDNNSDNTDSGTHLKNPLQNLLLVLTFKEREARTTILIIQTLEQLLLTKRLMM